MPQITFRSPSMDRDVIVYATAGDCHTLLRVAQDAGVPIPFDCEDGECASCVIKVTLLSDKPPLGIDLTEKEKARLEELSLVSPEQIEAAEQHHVPPPYRLACQLVLRDEPVLVEFTGEAGEVVD